MKRLLPPMIALTFSALTLVACGKNGGGSNSTKSVDKITVSEYKDLLKGKFQSNKGSLEFKDNQFNERNWMEVRHATEYYENDFYIECDVERKGTYKVVKAGEGLKLKVDVKEFIIHGAKAARRGEDISAFSADKLKRLCSGVISKFRKIEADLISASNNHVHFVKGESYSEYDSAESNYKVNFSELSHDYSYYYIKGDELNITQSFGQTFSGVYGEEYGNQLKINLDELSGELSYEQNYNSCSSSGQFKVFYSLKNGLEFRMNEANPCDQFNAIRIYDFYSEFREYHFSFHSPFGIFYKIQRGK